MMNVMVGGHKTRVYRRWGLFIALLSVLSFALEARPQGNVRANDFLPPPRPNLLPLRWPDLKTLEPEVREQLAKLQAALAATSKNPQTTGAALSEAYGTMGENYQSYS